MPRSVLPVALLLVSLSALAPLAFAGPSDPLWIGGVFDAADADDAVLAATSTEGINGGTPRDAVKTLWLVLGAVPRPRSVGAIRVGLPRFQGRAPPTV